MSLGSPDGNGLGRYAESTPVGATFSGYLNMALVAVSKLFGRPMQFTNLTAQNAHTGMVAGDKARRLDTGITMRYNGSAWKEWESDWISFTPIVTGVTLGTGGTNTVEYKFVAGDVRVRGRIILGTGGVLTSAVVMTLPFAAASLPFTTIFYIAAVTLFDASVPATVAGFVRANGALSGSVIVQSLTAGAPAGLSATAPWTWAVGDGITYDFTYRPA